MIQRTVVESRRSSIDQRLASGVQTLATQYSAVLDSSNAALNALPRNSQLQQAVVDKDTATVRKLAHLSSVGNLIVTVADARGKLITLPQGPNALSIKRTRIGTPRAIATVHTYVDLTSLIGLSQQADKD
ncbi:MAG TPA: hypothetical protein VGK92_02185, partial [Gaiellales bacterium]